MNPIRKRAAALAIGGLAAAFASLPATPARADMADDIPVAHTPPGGYGKTFPPPVLATCTEPLVLGAPDLRGIWKAVHVVRDGKPLPPGDPMYGYAERIEQCGNRIVAMGHGQIADARADGTAKNAVHEVSALDFETPIVAIASYEDGVFVLRPLLIRWLPVTIPGIAVTRELLPDGRVIWKRPDLGRQTVTLERIGGPNDTYTLSAPAHAGPRVVMVSIDGLRPEVYRDPNSLGLRMPNLAALSAAGASAQRMIPVFPSVTYPAHTSLVTGTRPSEHGVVTNFVRDQEWFLNASDIRSPTLWQAAEAAGKTTAIVTWPATYGAQVDFLVPENLAFRTSDVRSLLRDGSTPGLFEQLEQECGKAEVPAFEAPDAGERLDAVTTCFAAELLRTRKPELLLLHYLDADHRMHFAGVDSREAHRAFERIDGLVGELRKAVRDAGVDGDTIFVIVGDHGFVPVHTSINVNALLLEAGFAKLAAGKIAAPADLRVSALGGSAAIYLRDSADRKLAARLESALRAETLRRYHGLVELLSRAELDALGAFPGAALGLAAAEGYMLIAADSPAPSVPSAPLQGMHGYRPSLPGMATGFIAAGPGIRRGVELPVVRQIDVAPTVATLLRVRLEDAVGVPIAGILESADPGGATH